MQALKVTRCFGLNNKHLLPGEINKVDDGTSTQNCCFLELIFDFRFLTIAKFCILQ